jgi:arylsulfatase A-like enzyme
VKRNRGWNIVRGGLALIVACLLLLTRKTIAQETTSPPNIVLIVADDLGFKDLGYRGAEIKTPHIDTLAREGVRLSQHYVLPLCSPTRACLLTGRHPMRQGLQRLVVYPWSQFGLPLNERTLPQALKERGYATYMSGKWHLGHCEKAYLPMQRGFEQQYGVYNGAIGYYSHEIENGLDWHRNGKPLVEKGYSTELIGAEAVRMIEQHDSAKPMFLYVAFNAPHAPLMAPQGYLDKYAGVTDAKRRTFAAMVSCLDDQVGKVTDALSKRGMAQNSIIIFMSDNGGALGSGADNGNLRGGKGFLYEGGMRVPCFVNWPGKLAGGRIVDEPVHCSDWYPTLLKIAGAPATQPLKVDGMDIWPTLADGKPTPHAEILHNVTPESGAIRAGDWKLVVNADRVLKDAAIYGPISKRKPVADGPDKVELFNIRLDPAEKVDLAAKQPAKVAELKARLEGYAKEAVQPLVQPEPKDFNYPEAWEPER